PPPHLHSFPTRRSSDLAAFEADREQLLRLDREFHRQLLQHLLAEAVDDERQRILVREAALPAIEHLVLADLRCRRFVLDARRGVDRKSTRLNSSHRTIS